MATEGGKSHFLDAVIRWRLEYLFRRAIGDQCNDQMLSGVEAGRCAGHGPTDAARARGSAEFGWGAADEYILKTVPRAAWPLSLELRPDNSLRSDPHRKMVL